MTFQEAVKYLYGLGNEVLAMKLGLENIGALLGELGRPQDRFFKVQIAGTNGKGSTCAMLESICRAAGIRVGATTSPHLISVTERVRIDGRNISEADFARIATRVREASEGLVARGILETVPTYFEQVTAVALAAFAESGVELAILETGLGGRFDATTAACADLVAITRIDLDHQRILGDSIDAIAAEKAAIINSGTVVVVGDQPAEARRVIDRRCAEVGVVPKFSDSVGVKHNGDEIAFESGGAEYRVARLGLAGDHQIENARTAILLAEALRDRFAVPGPAIEHGLETAVHRGRLERHGKFLFDGAHNENGATALRRYLDRYVPGPIVMVFGAMRDKDLNEILRILLTRADSVILTRPDNIRSMQPSEIADAAARHCADVRVEPTVAAAVRLAEKIAPAAATIVVTGSLYLVGEAIAELESRGAV